MARSVNQKLKVLYIIRLLAASDESHEVTMGEILNELETHGISAERKSIYDDMEALRQFGLEIVGRRGRPSGYYLKNREQLRDLFSLPAGTESAEKVMEKVTGKVAESAGRPGWQKGKTKVGITCSKALADNIMEQLGDGADVRSRESGGKKSLQTAAALKFRAEPGEEFYRWLAGFGCDVKLTSPGAAVRGYRKYLKEIRNMYKED